MSRLDKSQIQTKISLKGQNKFYGVNSRLALRILRLARKAQGLPEISEAEQLALLAKAAK
jgi:hypothetical protein